MFPDTRWTLIAAATLNGDAAGRRALEALCKAYWPAVVTFLEGQGHSHEEAEDMVQEFFAAVIESGLWHRADQARGRFRSFSDASGLAARVQGRDDGLAAVRKAALLGSSAALEEETASLLALPSMKPLATIDSGRDWWRVIPDADLTHAVDFAHDDTVRIIELPSRRELMKLRPGSAYCKERG